MKPIKKHFASKYKNGGYLANHPSWDAKDSPPKAQEILSVLQRNNIKPKSIADIGCGAGEVLVSLKSRLGSSVKYCGYDPSPQAYRLCLAQKAGINFYNADFPRNAFFDLVLAIDVVEHVQDYQEFLRRIKQVGNYKIFKIPLEISAKNALKPHHLVKAQKKDGHIHFFSKENAIFTLKELGYKIIDYRYTYKTYWSLNPKSLFGMLIRYLIAKLQFEAGVRLMGDFSLIILAK